MMTPLLALATYDPAVQAAAGIAWKFMIGFIVVIFVNAIFQYLWNITMPQVFRLPKITLWQSLRLLIISSFLFGTFVGISNFFR